MSEQAWAAGAETISIQTVLKIAELRARFAKQSESIRTFAEGREEESERSPELEDIP